MIITYNFLKECLAWFLHSLNYDLIKLEWNTLSAWKLVNLKILGCFQAIISVDSDLTKKTFDNFNFLSSLSNTDHYIAKVIWITILRCYIYKLWSNFYLWFTVHFPLFQTYNKKNISKPKTQRTYYKILN